MIQGGNKEVFSVNVFAETYMRTEVNPNQRCGKGWKQLPGQFKYIAAAE